MDIHLSEESRRFIAEQVASGRYASEDALLEDAVTRMRQEVVLPCGSSRLDNDALWGMFRDEPELIDELVRHALHDRASVALRVSRDD